MATKWPLTVTAVGDGDVIRGSFDGDNQPGCTLGWAGGELFGDTWHYDTASRTDKFCKAYIRCARACEFVSFVEPDDDPAIINNRENYEIRSLLHNAAMAALGYVVGQQKEAVALARKAGFKV